MKVSIILCSILLSVSLFAAELQHPSKQKWDGKAFYKATKQSLPFAMRILDTYPLKKYKSILDVGCGPGTLSVYMAKKTDKNTHVAGFDPSESMIKFAQGYYQQPANLYFRQYALPLTMNNWDFIFSCNMFHLLTREKQIETLKTLAVCAMSTKTVPLLMIMAAKTDKPQAFERAYAATLAMPQWEKLRAIKLEDYFQPHDAQSFEQVVKGTRWEVKKTELQDEKITFKNVKRLKKFITSWMGGFEFVAQLPEKEQKKLLSDLVENYKKEVPVTQDGQIEWCSPRLIVHAEKSKEVA